MRDEQPEGFGEALGDAIPFNKILESFDAMINSCEEKKDWEFQESNAEW